ncbi:hypothetical protein PIB30_078906 [Stylosanthes scabra]|uniref:Uncharacterized protein n=1 Tax=Stylosanthes scabra TaxID=79078 RepID=A0ABU6XPC2_9FABA|nr:hypothetical protein [Stylosanthes scabra]
MRHSQTVQEAASQRAREANKGKAKEVVSDSEEEESEEMYSSPSEKCKDVLAELIVLSEQNNHGEEGSCVWAWNSSRAQSGWNEGKSRTTILGVSPL